MSAPWKSALEGQILANMDMLENAMRTCPPNIWADESAPIERRFWYLAYHTLFWLDRYLSPSPDQHQPPKPYTMGELDPAGVYPDRVYTKDELLEYLAYDRAKFHARHASLDDATAAKPSAFKPEFSVLEFHLYSCRHLTHHVAQLNLLLRQGGAQPAAWVARGELAQSSLVPDA